MGMVQMLRGLLARLQGPPKRRSLADVITIMERELAGTASIDEWDDFVCVPIEDPALDSIRKQVHFAGGELPQSRVLIERALVTLRERDKLRGEVAT